jgi:hypothetical protein
MITDTDRFIDPCDQWLTKLSSGGIAKDQPIEVGVVSQWVQVVIMLRTHAEVWLQIQRFLQ